MSERKPFVPFDPLLGAGRAIAYRPHWNLLTGSHFASILLQQITFWWKIKGRKPFYKYAAPCDSARLGDSWQEELGFSRRQFERARASIAVRTQRQRKEETLKSNMVVYWTEPNHRTYYEVNESLLLVRLADALVSTGPVTPDAQLEQLAAARNEQQTVGQSEQPPLDKAASSCTEKTINEQQRDGGGGDGTDLDEGLVDGLARLGDNNPRELVARYPAAEIGRWLNYVLSRQGANLRNKPGFIRAKLKQGAGQRQPPGSRRAAHESGVNPAEAERVWSACLEELAQQVPALEFAAWLDGTRGLELRAGTLRVAVGNRYVRDSLNHSLRPTLDQAVAAVSSDLEIEFVVIPNP